MPRTSGYFTASAGRLFLATLIVCFGVSQGQIDMYGDDVNGNYGDYSNAFTPNPKEIYYTARIGKVCRNAQQCGPNEICRKNEMFKSRAAGLCECQRCFGYDPDQQMCAPMTVKNRVCDRDFVIPTTSPSSIKSLSSDNSTLANVTTTTVKTTTSTKPACISPCKPLSHNELYPPNAQCGGDGFVVCAPCYVTSYDKGSCVLKVSGKQKIGETCSSDCECSSNLKCRPTCRCPGDTKWDSKSSRCIKAVVKFGDVCQSDSDCTLDSNNTNLRYASKQGSMCFSDDMVIELQHGRRKANATSNSTVSDYYDEIELPKPTKASNTTKRCDCSWGYVVTPFAYVNPETGYQSQRKICVSEDSLLVQKADICHPDPVEASELYNGSYVCEAPEICFTCPEGQRTSYGRCRVMVPFTETQKARNKDLVWTQWAGKVCSRDSDCKVKNSICLKHPVDPPCRLGYCYCRAGFVADQNGLCVLYRRLKIADPCNETAEEIYPENSHCEKGAGRNGGNAVLCNVQYRKIGEKCVLDTFSYVGYGSVCGDNCQAPFVCGGATCQCPSTTHFWNVTSCVQRQLGDRCRVDADCDAIDPPKKRLRAGRICPARGRCSCDPSFSVVDCLYPRQVDYDWKTFVVNNDDDYFRNDYNYCVNYLKRNNFTLSSDYTNDDLYKNLAAPPTTTPRRAPVRAPSKGKDILAASAPQNNNNLAILVIIIIALVHQCLLSRK